MIKTWTQTIEELGLTKWKLLFFRKVDAAQNWHQGQSDPIQHQESWTCRAKIYKDFFNRRRKWTAEKTLELSAHLEAAQIKSQLQKTLADLEEDPWPWFPMYQGPSGPGLTQESSLAKKPNLSDWLPTLAEAFFRTADKGADASFKAISLETLYLDSLGRQMEHVGHWCEVDMLGKTHSLKVRLGEFLPDRITLKAQRFEEECRALEKPAVWEGQPPSLVVLGGEVPGLMFSYLLRQLDGAALYSGDSTLALGQPLYHRTLGDKITLKPLVKLYNSPYSRWFDEEGVMLKETELVRDGVIKSFTASQREAHFLGIPVTGHPVNFSVGPGSLSKEELRVSPYLEIYYLSDWKLDEASGEFSAAIPFAMGSESPHQGRQAYQGLALRGNLRELLASSRWSTNISQREYFEGPEFLAIPAHFLVYHT